MFPIFDFDSFILIYNFVNSENVLDEIKNELDKKNHLIPKLRMSEIKNHPDWITINSLSEMKVKKVRKCLLLTDFNLIREFNETLKPIYPNKRSIQFLHTKENWINELLLIIKKKSKELLYGIENLAGYDFYEKNRLDFDYRIVRVYDDYHTGFHYHDFKENDPEWSDKIICSCVKDILYANVISLIFEKGKHYFYRKNVNDLIYVYSKFEEYYFEGESFFEYFISPESRDKRLEKILN